MFPYSLDIQSVQQLYQSGERRPSTLIADIYRALLAWADHNIWIHLIPEEVVLIRARQLEALSPEAQENLPLFGIPFAIKDNMDVAGLPTTAGCPEFSYVPTVTATAVQKLLDAGAILIGKTNLDQFATGLVGSRSPYGACRNAFDGRYISGGSSSGSAVAVAAGLVSFALGTDTAGSGRVPAGFNNIVGLKPTRGLISTYGVVPACRSLDCVSIFALTCADATDVLTVCQGEDSADPFSRPAAPAKPFSPGAFRFGVPWPEQLTFFGDEDAACLFADAVARLTRLGGTAVPVDYAPFLATAVLLYDGPWVAERLAAIELFFQSHADALLPVTAEIFRKGEGFTAVDTFNAQYQLQALQKQIAPVWDDIDMLVLPTAGTIYTLAEVAADPITLNNHLGVYTNFVNLLDLCALAVPNGFQANGLPMGITLVAPALQDGWLNEMGTIFHYDRGVGSGVGQQELPPRSTQISTNRAPEIELAVFGLHLTGQPLNHQLTTLGAAFVRADKTAAEYRLFAIHDARGSKPGAVLVTDGSGTAVDLEIWKLPVANIGPFVAQVPPPLGIGTVKLADGQWVKGFICEGYIAEQAEEITHLAGGWHTAPPALKEEAMSTLQIKAEPKPVDIVLAETAVIVIDMQKDFLYPHGFGDFLGNDVTLLQRAIPPIQKLLTAVRAAHMLVIHTREGHLPDLSDCPPAKRDRWAAGTRIGDRGPMGRILIRGEAGHALIDELLPLSGEIVLDKPGKNAFYHTNLDAILQENGIKNLLITGVTTDVCCNATTIAANDHGYNAIVLADCVASYSEERHWATLATIKAQGGIFGWVAISQNLLAALSEASPAS